MILLDESHLEPTLLISPEEKMGCISLPIFTTVSDIRELVQYLKNKPTGVTVSEELDKVKKRLFDERKLEAYAFLGITEVEKNSVRLTALGLKFAKDLEAEERAFRYLLEITAPYWNALNWIHHQSLDVVTSTDILGYWRQAYSEAIQVNDADAMRGAVVPFFSLCQASALGTMTLGKRGHTTRLCVDRYALVHFLQGRVSAISGRTIQSSDTELNRSEHAVEFIDQSAWRRQTRLRVIVLQSKNTVIMDLIRRTLEIAHVHSQTVEAIWDSKASVDNAFHEIHRDYNALLVVLDEDSFTPDNSGKYCLKEKVLLGIGAAHVFYNGRVILLADRRFQPPAGIRDLILYEFERDCLDRGVGLQLIKIVEDFKNEIQQNTTH